MIDLAPLRGLLEDIAEIKINKKKSHKYNGPEVTHHSILAMCDNIKGSFSKDNIEYQAERGKDKINIFIAQVFHLGYSEANSKNAYEKMYTNLKKDYNEDRERWHNQIEKLENQLKNK